jgi:hypothetical protein
MKKKYLKKLSNHRLDLLVLFLSLFFLITLRTCNAAAQDKTYTTRYSLPKVPITYDSEGLPQKCLNTEQWKVVVLMASDYVGLYDWRLQTLGILSAHESLAQDYESRIQGLQYQIEVLKDDRKYLTMRLDQSYKFGQQQVKSRKIERIMMWAVIVVQSGVILVGGIKGIAN